MPLLTKDQRGGKSATVKQSLTVPRPCVGCNKPQPAQDLTCIHRGEQTETPERPCRTCSGKPIAFFSCALHGECTLQKRVNQISVCASCPDRQAE
jgi:hypothetical protein